MLTAGGFDSADTAAMRLALIEGDAERVALNYYWSLSADEQQAYIDALGFDLDAAITDPGNRFNEASFYASYEVGRPLVESIIATDGVDGLNTLLRSKDVGTTERLTDPLGADRRSTDDASTRIRLPVGVDASVGDLGSITWFQALAPVVGTGPALDAVIGYDDDTFAIFDADGETCARFMVLFDSEGDAAEFAAIVGSLSGVSSLAVELDGVQVDICDPIGDPQDQRFGTILPLIVSAEMASMHLVNGEPVEVARCASLAQAKTIDAQESMAGFVGWDSVMADAAGFLDSCR